MQVLAPIRRVRPRPRSNKRCGTGTVAAPAPLSLCMAGRRSCLLARIFQKGYVMPRNDEHKGTSHRGFASMDEAKQRAIASKGGQSVPPEKRSFSQNPNLAAEAGRKGGENVPSHERSFSRNRALAAEAGRKGGQSSRSGARRTADGGNGASDGDGKSREH